MPGWCAGGGTEVFRFATAFAGTFTFVVFVGVFALEFSRGTYRTMLLRLLAPAFGVSAGAWTGLDALGAAVVDLASMLVWVTGYAVLGMTVAVLLRSVPLALAVGIAWAGPTEHLLADAWEPATRVFPGLLLEVVGWGGTPEVTFTRALLTVVAYTAAAAAVSATVFAHRDVTT